MRVDGEKFHTTPELHQAKIRVVAAFTVKLAVEADLVRVLQARDHLEEYGVRSDMGGMHGRRSIGQRARD
jgi:hypothetical protein